jgi:predicted transglutaminase-like cysteine proteinase
MSKKAGRTTLSVVAAVAMIGQAEAFPFIPFRFTLPAASSAMQSGPITMAPLPAVKFCVMQVSECSPAADQLVTMDLESFATLSLINQDVNANIQPVHKAASGSIDTWAINPSQGDCNDYAVTKRHQLMQLGLPSSALLLAAVQTARGEGHLVLVVRTDRGDYVLDNLTNQIRSWRATGYRWVKRQSIDNPQDWTAVVPGAGRPVQIRKDRAVPPTQGDVIEASISRDPFVPGSLIEREWFL